jgi:uncharacterized membrane protein (UPF0182 family)
MAFRSAARFGRRQIFVLLFLALFVIPSTVDFYIDWLWFGETGYQQVFLRSLTARTMLGTATFLIAFAFIALNVRLAWQTLRPRELVLMTPDGPRHISIDPRRYRLLAYGLAAALALFVALAATANWETWLMYRHATPFGERDPILGRDIGFYVFELPFLQVLRGLLLAIAGLTFAGVGVLYAVSGLMGIDQQRGFYSSATANRHLAGLVALILLILGFGAYLAVPATLTAASGIIHGASYVDVHAKFPALRILMAASVVAAAVAIAGGLRNRLSLLAAGAGLYLVVALAGAGYAAALQRFVVAPNEQVKETPYIVHNIAATRKAFALDRIEERQLSGDVQLTREDIERNDATLKNVRLWDHQPLLDTFGQIQEIRTYYDFVSVDNDRYVINGEYRQIMLSARELNSASLPNRTWINERLTFTHGYGLTLGPVNQVTSEGLPVLFIKNLPPESTVDLQVKEPSIYFGELSSDHVFVRTATAEFHYPKGDDNVTAKYEGRAGVSAGSFFRRLLFAVKFRSMKTLLSNDFTPDTRIIYHRRIQERVAKIAPFLIYDSDPYLAIADERLYWIQDAYTTSGAYPYSTPAAARLNYIRNSVKVIIDAYHGTTTYYLIDSRDPIAATIGRIFPDLFTPLSAMPEGLRARLRYPEDIFSLQTAMYSTYHMTNPAVFYNKEDQWEIPAIDARGQMERMQPYYTIMKLPGGAGPEFIQMLPFTPRQKDNLAAWMVARSDGDNYGRLLAFQFPKQKVVFGPRQVVNRIAQDQVISPQITLWNQQGSEVIQGTLLVIPIEESLIYIRPLYLRASGGKIPELKRVIVAHHNQIVMEETLEKALERIFPAGAARPAVVTTAVPATPGTPPPPPPTETNLAALAREHYRRAIQAQREGNWAQYGEEIRKLGEVIERMAGQRE